LTIVGSVSMNRPSDSSRSSSSSERSQSTWSRSGSGAGYPKRMYISL